MAFVQTIATLIALLLGGTILEGLRRLYFHPLAHIPGPRLAALTWWYDFYWEHIQQGRYVFHIQELHKIYGPIIRVTPDEVHICDVGFLDSIYAPSTHLRDKYDWNGSGLRIAGSIGATVEQALHKKRRQALEPFFSKKNVLQMEALITSKVEQMSNVLAGNEGKVVNMSDLFFGVSSDITNNFLFAHKSDVLADLDSAAIIRRNTHDLLKGIYINKHLWIIPAFFQMLPDSWTEKSRPPGVSDMMALNARVSRELDIIRQRIASGDSLGNTKEQSVYQAILENPDLPPEEKAKDRLEREGTLLVLAGTESPAKTLEVITFYLLANPKILKRLYEELNSLSSDASWTQLDQLPYLAAVIEEGNRLSFGVTLRSVRRAHEVLTYTPSAHVSDLPNSTKSYIIPAYTPLSTTTLSAHTAETVFPDPWSFDPDRWLGYQGRQLRKYQLAMSKGSRKCIGMELAKAELCLTVAALVRGFDLELFETDESDIKFQHSYITSRPKLNSKGIRVLVRAVKS